MVDLGSRTQGAVTRLAVVMDVRSRAFSTDLRSVIRDLADRQMRPRVLFLEARNDVLVRRFENVRREHPLQGDGRLIDGIAAERQLLAGLRDEADLVIDTSDRSVHELRRALESSFTGERCRRRAELRATVVSFGYKYGLPVDADLVVDVRFLPNPFWIPELRELTGRDEPVRDYVLARRARASSSTATPTSCASSAPATGASASATSRWPSAAPAASTARWRWPAARPAADRDGRPGHGRPSGPRP